MNWMRIACMDVPLFHKFHIYDFLQGLSIGLGLVACFEIIAALVTAWRTKRHSGPGAGPMPAPARVLPVSRFPSHESF